MRFDKFGVSAIIVGLLILAGMMQFYLDWNWWSLVLLVITGGIVWFALVIIIIGLLLILL